MGKLILVVCVFCGIVLLGIGLLDISTEDAIRAEVLLPPVGDNIAGFTRAVAPYDWSFPADYGIHPDFQTEWWYYTGNLSAEDGRRFGFQFTVFRRALLPDLAESDSGWRTNQVYMAHVTLTDVTEDTFYQDQRFSRGGAGLAGAAVEPQYRVWLEDWQVVGLDEAVAQTQLTAQADDFSLNLTFEQVKPPALQGDNGLSAKGETAGNASYYYSLSRLLTGGTITVGDEIYTVSGSTWMDHEFSTRALGDDAQGWDWFGLHLNDGRDLMVGQIRRQDDTPEPAFGGLLIEADGRTHYLAAGDFTIVVVETWTSPHTGATYPAGWTITVDGGAADPLRLQLVPLVADQELHEGTAYWEGAVQISGDVSGYGYAELTGYTGTMNGRF